MCIERQSRAGSSSADFAVHLHSAVERLPCLSPLKQAGLERGGAQVDHKKEGRQVRHGLADSFKLSYATSQVLYSRKVASLQTIKEKRTWILLGRPVQDPPRLHMLRLPLSPWLPEEAAHVHRHAHEHEPCERRLDPALLPALLQLPQRGLPAALEARDPACRAHRRGRQHRREEVEDAQRQQRRGAHAAPLVALEVQAVRLEVSEPEPGAEDLPDTSRDAALHDLHHAGDQQAEATEDGPAGPLAVRGQQLVGRPDALEDGVQLVVLQRGHAVEQAHDGADQGEAAAEVVLAAREVDVAGGHLPRRLLQRFVRIRKVIVQHHADALLHDSDVLLPTGQRLGHGLLGWRLAAGTP
mmetsp:Transcript_103474/g.301898  ORF Transcript_103474/g.301898 Transcript_103474/m.301898 type:complete len:355 (+) Transcript_103474:1055-2119(+)